MSELIDAGVSRIGIRRQLLVTVSSLVLMTAGADAVLASDAPGQPSVWIELGGQLERLDGGQDAFLPPFTTLTPTPGPYFPVSPAEAQKPSIYGYGGEGKLSFRPDQSDWVFSAAIRYGRSNSKKRLHQQTMVQTVAHFPGGPIITHTQITVSGPIFADYQTRNEESHTVLDFTAGRDVGLGLLGRNGSSTFNAGIRFAEFGSHSQARIIAQPELIFHDWTFLGKYHFQIPNHYNYIATNEADRSFRGLGPSVSWDASASVLGDPDRMSVTVDWAINAAILIGRQKAMGRHSVDAAYYVRTGAKYYPNGAEPVYYHATAHDRSRSVVVPNIGGMLGMSFRYPNAKVSFGYRADFFFGAIDTGLDARHTVDRNFYGPFATVSVGLGG